MKRKRYFIGNSCLCWSFGNQIRQDISAQVLKIFHRLNDKQTQGRLGIKDLIPSYNALAVCFDPAVVSIRRFTKQIENEIDQILAEVKSKRSVSLDKTMVHKLPVVYSGEDLKRVADLNQLSVADVIRLHKIPEYTVAMIGFQPHFPYLIGLEPRLKTPRLDSPRTKVPSGSVAIGGAQTGIYPKESPGGWNVIGTTDPILLMEIEPGDKIIFDEVDSL